MRARTACRIAIVHAIGVLVPGLNAQERIDRVSGWRSDAEVLLAELGRQHYVLRRGPLPDSIRRAGARFAASIERWSDERALAELMRIAAMAGDGHTYALPFGARAVASRMLPLRFYQFADGMYVIDADSAHERWIGAEVLGLAGTAPGVLMSRIAPYVARDNATGILWTGPFLLGFAGYLEALTDQRLGERIAVRLRMGGLDTVLMVRPAPPPRMRGLPKLLAPRRATVPPPLYLRDVGNPYWRTELADTILYVQFNQVQDADGETLAQFAQRLGRDLQRQRIRLVLVDIRHNNGGNAELLHPLIDVLAAHTRNGGQLTVITGRNTFSAAQIFLGRAVHEAGARVVGEPSSSRPNFVGEENVIMLPWSGGIVSISNRYHETIPGDTRLVIPPRPLIQLTSRSYFANRDPVVEAILGYRPPQ